MPDSVVSEQAPVSPASLPDTEMAIAFEDAEPQPGDWVRALLVMTLIFGALSRLAAARHLSPHIDEPASVLAAEMVRERGFPIFPSGVPYFQGATLSYLLQPLIWLGLGDITDLHAMRIVSVIAGVLTIGATYLLARQVSGQRWIGVVAAMLLAIDPSSIKWSGLVRMYGLLELVSVLLVLVFTTTMMDGVTRPRLISIAVLFWLAIFTHIATVLLLPPMLLVAFAVYGRALWHKRRDLGLTLVVSAVAPVALTVLNELLQTTGARASAGGDIPGVSFVGDHLFHPSTILSPAFDSWEELFLTSTLSHVTPYVMVLISAALFGIWFLSSATDAPDRRSRIGVGSMLACYWIPVIIVGMVTNEPQERYLLLIVPTGAAIVAISTLVLADRAIAMMKRGLVSWQRWAYAGAAIFLIFLIVVQQGSGILGLQRQRQLDPDYIAASQWVDERREPGQLVLSAMTPAPYLVFGEDKEDLAFFSGNAYSIRTQRYTRVNDDGEIVDYWIGVPSVYLVNDLCTTLQENPKAWILIDRARLYNGLAFGGYLAQVLDGMTYVAYLGPANMLVLRPSPAPSHKGRADSVCARAADLAAQGITEMTWPTPPLVFR